MPFKIDNFDLSTSTSTFIIAELSANHIQNFEIAAKTIKAAKECGANAVKLQTYTADKITIDSSKEHFKIKGDSLWQGKTLYQLYKQAYTPWEWHPKLKKIANDWGLILFSSPFDFSAVDFLEQMNVPAYKIASFEITDIPLIEYVAAKNKPVIISTGIATLSDIEQAVNACRRSANDQIALLKCSSAYPAPIEEINLKTIPNMRDTFNCPVGLSDHTLGISVAVAAVALGARIIEKHFILDKKLGGPDAAFSIEPEPFKQMVKSIREVEQALGTIDYQLSEKAKKNRNFSRSLFAIKDIKKNTTFSEENVRSIRPGYGLPPVYLKSILGRKAKYDIPKGTPLNWDMIE